MQSFAEMNSRLNVLVIILVLISFISDSVSSQWRTFTDEFVSEPTKPSCRNPSAFKSEWILQFSNHFSELDPTVWRQRFYANRIYYQLGGPIYIIIGGPWRISPQFVCSGLVMDAAKATNGAVFYLEHRFYGESIPKNSQGEIDLALLTRSQTIEDIRYFITHIKSFALESSDSPVILIGTHVSGSLAVWTRLKYPLLVDGVWATGAPLAILANENVPGFSNQIESYVENLGEKTCFGSLREVFKILKSDFQNQQSADLRDIFKMDGFDFESLLDQSTFLYRLYCELIKTVLDRNLEGATNLCAHLRNPEYLDSVEAFASYFLNNQRLGDKLDYSFKGLVQQIGNSSDMWLYQSCAEYGWFPESTDDNWLMPNFFQSLCFHAFDILPEHRTIAQDETRMLLNMLMSGNIGNILLSYGVFDPWVSVGLENSNRTEMEFNTDILVIKTDNHLQSPFLRPLGREDSSSMQKLKLIVQQKLEKWSERDRKTLVLLLNSASNFPNLALIIITINCILLLR